MSKRRGNGEGTVAKRKDGRWEARLRLSNGKRKSFYGETEREVRQKLREASNAQERNEPLVNERLTVAQFLTEWLESKRRSVRPKTWQRYKEIVTLHLIPEIGRLRLARLTTRDVNKLYDEKLKGLSKTSVHHLATMLHGALESAVQQGILARNVCKLVEQPQIERRELTELTLNQAQQLLRAASGHRFEALFLLALTTGMRQGELLGLRWSDVDWDNGRLFVHTSLSYVREQPEDKLHFVLGRTKTKRSDRKVRLIARAMEALRTHQARQIEERQRLGDLWDESYDLVFPNGIGRPIEATNFLRREFHPLLEKAGLPHMRFHDLRHSAVTFLLADGNYAKVVSTLVGLSSAAFTLDQYGYVTPDMQEALVQTMEKLFGENGRQNGRQKEQ